jgi:hypothetical protein
VLVEVLLVSILQLGVRISHEVSYTQASNTTFHGGKVCVATHEGKLVHHLFFVVLKIMEFKLAGEIFLLLVLN